MVCRNRMEFIQITSGFTSITVMPSEIIRSGSGRERSVARRNSRSTGARVTLEFTRTEQLLSASEIRIRYDIAENGTYREFTGTPQLTHNTTLGGASFYHYRISHWIAAHTLSPLLSR